MAEIKLAKKKNKPIRYFTVISDKKIKEISKDEVEFEKDLEAIEKEKLSY